MSSVIFRHAAHNIPDVVITWAGICPWTNTYFFGSETGRVGISAVSRRDLYKPGMRQQKNLKVSTSPVNGVAFLGQFAAVSTRQEIVILRYSKVSKAEPLREVLLHENGAHGVLAVNGVMEFVAPIGTSGLICVTPYSAGQSNVRLVQTPERGLNFYRLASVATSDESALLASACRKGGVAAFWLVKGQSPSAIARHVFGKGDIVDVAAISDPRSPRGVVGLSKDGSLVWIPDVLASDPPRTISPRVGVGTAYSLLLVKGQGLILAEDTLSCLPDLVNGLISKRESIDGFTLPFSGDELLPAPPDSFFLLTDGQPKEFEIELFIHDAKSLRDDAPVPEPPPEIPYFSKLLPSKVSLSEYRPAELGWSREPDAQFSTQLVG
jgi:hypothetical protein